MKIDILVNNYLGVINSKFLSVYAGVRWVRNLGILVKLWGKKLMLINKDMFSSYSMVLMLIHFLLEKGKVKKILDNRIKSKDRPHFVYKREKKGQI